MGGAPNRSIDLRAQIKSQFNRIAKRSEVAGRAWRETRFEVRDVYGKLVAARVRRGGSGAVTNHANEQMWWETPDGHKGLGGIKVKCLPLFGADLMRECMSVMVPPPFCVETVS